MQLTIRITCDSPPFEDDPIGEIERVLKQLVFRLAWIPTQLKLLTYLAQVDLYDSVAIERIPWK